MLENFVSKISCTIRCLVQASPNIFGVDNAISQHKIQTNFSRHGKILTFNDKRGKVIKKIIHEGWKNQCKHQDTGWSSEYEIITFIYKFR